MRMAEITLKAQVRVVEVGEAGGGGHAITLGFEDGEVMFLASMDQCRAAAPALFTDVEATVTFTVPGVSRG